MPVSVESCPTADELSTILERRSRPDWLWSHLARCDGCRAIVSTYLGSGDDSQVSYSWRGLEPRLTPGRVVAGRFKVQRFLARGGMGEVYEVVDTELQETLALKVIANDAISDPLLAIRFRREAQLARRVTDQNVCRILEFGIEKASEPPHDDLYFIVMEFLKGTTLNNHVKSRGALTKQECIDVLVQMASGLAAIHRASVVHGDLKSDNVFLVEAVGGTGGRVVLMDFGLARSAARDDGSSFFGSRIAGTPEYMAPEQLRGGGPSEKADIYSFGVIMMELLTGHKPTGVSGESFQRAVRTVNRRNRLLPRTTALESIAARCLAQDPIDRFESAQKVLQELRGSRYSRAGLPRSASWASVVLLGSLAAFASQRLARIWHHKAGTNLQLSPSAPQERPNFVTTSNIDAAAGSGSFQTAFSPRQTSPGPSEARRRSERPRTKATVLSPSSEARSTPPPPPSVSNEQHELPATAPQLTPDVLPVTPAQAKPTERRRPHPDEVFDPF